MIDFHNHVLPNLDDGSTSMDMSVSMLETASSQGIKTVVNTIHFQHPKMENKNIDYDYVRKIKDELVLNIKKKDIDVDIKLAAEVYYLPNLCDLIDNPLLTINNYMLVEFPMAIIPPNYLDTFFKLKVNGCTPILAHPERYRVFQDDVDSLSKCLDIGVVFQLDAGSLIGHFGDLTRKSAFEMISRGYCHIIGSDAHSNLKRNFCLQEAYDIIGSFDKDAIELLKKNSENIVNGENNLNQVKVSMKRNLLSFLMKKMKIT
ncbi:MAG: hypothetical protein CBD97_01170 [Pelagibacteraceae bacterium TMED237]|nr:hypothetical protein [Candidatus Neomarinimicrobiota bacterium]OUW96605.1 MAG: hypothetical protein CBD97_01170 [Pelagibacteraceae bacterium TMED237]|tara:strand:- start:1170 stop:1949 length:780 start_codon:yes stop_codon:yes gene_type:complete